MKSKHFGLTTVLLKRKCLLICYWFRKEIEHQFQCNLSSTWSWLGTPGKTAILEYAIGKKVKNILKHVAKILNNDRFIYSYNNYSSSPNSSQSNLTSFVLSTNVYLLDSSVKTSFCLLIISLERAATFFFSIPEEQEVKLIC